MMPARPPVMVASPPVMPARPPVTPATPLMMPARPPELPARPPVMPATPLMMPARPPGLRMLHFTLLALLCACVSTQAGEVRSSSYSGEYGGGGGKRFSQSGNQLDGPITALRIRTNWLYITGLQVRYGTTWSAYQGGRSGDLNEIFLHPGEHITHVSGKYKSYIRRLNFITNNGRHFPFGKDTGSSFNAAPLFPNTVLRYISGSSGSVIDAIGFHWDVYNSNCGHCV